jgi:glycerol-3-phosphate acyltransferase PlsY
LQQAVEEPAPDLLKLEEFPAALAVVVAAILEEVYGHSVAPAYQAKGFKAVTACLGILLIGKQAAAAVLAVMVVLVLQVTGVAMAALE